MPKTILLVDDEPDIVKVTSFRLEHAGFIVIVASDGAEGLEMARSLSPDLILLDIMLPQIPGPKVCRMLKFDERFQNIPIIMQSAKSADSDRNLAKLAGADDYFVKGSDSKILLEMIAKHLSKLPPGE